MKKCENEERVCVFCARASEIADRDEMLCKKRGVVAKDFVCRSFVYDPLKRVPRRRVFDAEELPSLE